MRSSWSIRHSRKSRAPTPAGSKVWMTFKHFTIIFSEPARSPWRTVLPPRFEVAVIIDVADQHLGDRPLLLRQADSRTCSSRFPGATCRATRESNMNCRFSSSSAEAGSGVRLGKMIPPFLVQLDEPFELRLKSSTGFVGLLFSVAGSKSRSAGGSARSASAGFFLRIRTLSPGHQFPGGCFLDWFCCNSCSTSAFSSEWEPGAAPGTVGVGARAPAIVLTVAIIVSLVPSRAILGYSTRSTRKTWHEIRFVSRRPHFRASAPRVPQLTTDTIPPGSAPIQKLWRLSKSAPGFTEPTMG